MCNKLIILMMFKTVIMLTSAHDTWHIISIFQIIKIDWIYWIGRASNIPNMTLFILIYLSHVKWSNYSKERGVHSQPLLRPRFRAIPLSFRSLQPFRFVCKGSLDKREEKSLQKKSCPILYGTNFSWSQKYTLTRTDCESKKER